MRLKTPRLVAAELALLTISPGVGYQQDAGLLAGWADKQVRTEYDPAADHTDMYFALLPSGPSGSFTMTFHVQFRGRTPRELPATVQVRVGTGMQSNPNVQRRVELKFVLGEPTSPTGKIDVSDRLVQPLPFAGAAIDVANVDLSLTEFIELIRADVISGSCLGMDFSLRGDQVEALRAFGMGILGAWREGK